ncbi:PREDICTED: 11-beta-hydroxysteroid dehydrogenase-like 4A [Tarenaya hassleriana]|uniref:11-beta-hydroxysteroid dehydrogenase-like 4A n=1 Tax=Tarenaya hassleriana TaxID=28532 RepID=UPI00053C68B5|nr:PREDICTED: 11-beta-hydroxysteroid dehydrogenase-like 4A [Tarenaya hassleriana]
MGLTNKTLNNVLPPFAFLFLLVSSPLLFLFKLFRYVQRCRTAENVAGKVVVITGASSGIGEHLAYEYARREARLTLVARREDRLKMVANRCRELGSPAVIVTRGDVSLVKDCKRFIEDTVSQFGRLDHLVNNAGTVEAKMFEEYSNISDAHSLMNTNFWGPVYATHFAVPHLKKSKGKIVAVASPAGWSGVPKMSIYAATKAAMINFYETLRMELHPDITITTVFPGLVENGVTDPELIAEARGRHGLVPKQSATECARAVVDGICSGKTSVAEPSWIGVLFWLSTMCPELMEWAQLRSMKAMDKNK